ncbi:MAG: type II toxin-antitoxin system RelE/ParE family toxin [Roseiarcus sp.]|jgi:toxin ParE1/3/4
MPEPKLQLDWSPEAEADLLAIWRWGASHFSPEIADARLRDIDRAASSLTMFPEAGVARDQLVAGIRSVVVYPTVIFYRITAAAIEIVRVVDGRRNLAAFFPSSGD